MERRDECGCVMSLSLQGPRRIYLGSRVRDPAALVVVTNLGFVACLWTCGDGIPRLLWTLKKEFCTRRSRSQKGLSRSALDKLAWSRLISCWSSYACSPESLIVQRAPIVSETGRVRRYFGIITGQTRNMHVAAVVTLGRATLASLNSTGPSGGGSYSCPSTAAASARGGDVSPPSRPRLAHCQQS